MSTRVPRFTHRPKISFTSDTLTPKELIQTKESFGKKLAIIFDWNFEIWDLCKGVYCIDLDESFHLSIYYLLAKFGFDTNRTTSDSDSDTAERERKPLSESVEEHREKTKKIPRKKTRHLLQFTLACSAWVQHADHAKYFCLRLPKKRVCIDRVFIY